jgi:hypothetical protein
MDHDGMFRHEDMMAKKASRSSGSRLGRTETVSIRLDPRLNYLCELAARAQRRTKSSYIEAMLDERIQTQVINKWRDYGNEQPDTFGERADALWHVKESQRLVSLGIIAPELMTIDEQEIWSLIEENGIFWRGRWTNIGWKWDMELGSIIRDRVDEHWDDLVAVAQGEQDPSVLPNPPAKPPSVPNDDMDDEFPF